MSNISPLANNPHQSSNSNYCYALFFNLGNDHNTQHMLNLINALVNLLWKDAGMTMKYCSSHLVNQDSDAKEYPRYLIFLLGISEPSLRNWASIRKAGCRLDPNRAIEHGRKLNFPLANNTLLPEEQSISNKKLIPIESWQNIYCRYRSSVNVDIFEHRLIDPEKGSFNMCKPGFQTTPFTQSEKLRLIYEKIAFPKNYLGSEIPIISLSRTKNHPLVAVFPLHTKSCRSWFMENWLKHYNFKSFFWAPLDEITDYFGAPIGYYFGFAQYYIRCLIPLSIIGLGYYFIMKHTRESFPSGYGEFMVIFVICWDVIFVDIWKRRESELRVKWGMSDLSSAIQKETFVGKWTFSMITGESLQVHHKSVYCFRRVIGISTLFVFLSIILTTYFFIFWLRYMRTTVAARVCTDGSTESINGCEEYRCLNSENGTNCAGPDDYVRRIDSVSQVILAIGNAVQILVYDWIFTKVSSVITNWENHKTQSIFDNFIVLKQFSFKFINAFISLFYLSYFQNDIERNGYTNDEIIDAVGIQLAVLFASSILLQNTIEVYRTKLIKKFIAYFGCASGVDKNLEVSQAEIEFALDEYSGTLNDMCELVIQYGYVTMFVMAYPLVPFMALISAIVEIRIDGYKLLHSLRRPIPYTAPGLGVWVEVLNFFSLLSVLNNVTLCIWLTEWPSRILSQSSDTITTRDKIFLILTISGILGIFVLMMQIYIPDVPRKSKTHYQRQEYIEDILCEGLKLEPEVMAHQKATSLTEIDRAKVLPSYLKKFFQNEVSKRHEELVVQGGYSFDPDRDGMKHFCLSVNDLSKVKRWNSLLQNDTFSEYDSKAIDINSSYKRLPNNLLELPEYTNSGMAREYPVLSKSSSGISFIF